MTRSDAAALASLIVRDVCEIPRDSPADDPQMMLVYPHELEAIVKRRLEEERP